jgi:hypothetical protein
MTHTTENDLWWMADTAVLVGYTEKDFVKKYASLRGAENARKLYRAAKKRHKPTARRKKLAKRVVLAKLR